MHVQLVHYHAGLVDPVRTYMNMTAPCLKDVVTALPLMNSLLA